ncbi:MAG: hypothetical protein JNJ48_04385 [Phycisphaerae bacterium]|nr:hypothetical protein [Phycisphaerae bacterium]
MSLSPAPHPPSIRTLLELTGIPTAAGREHRVVAFIERWVAARPALRLASDKAGNLIVSMKRPPRRARAAAAPLFITAHLDHPAFVVERIVAPGTLELSFRGGVNEVYFTDAPITLHLADGRTASATLIGKAPAGTPAGQHYLAELADADEHLADSIAVGDVATWLLLPPEIDGDGVLHTPCCDDLAAAAAALAAMDEILARRATGATVQDVRLLFTRAEEIGFVGAIAAVKLGSLPRGARVIALENSRAFADAPVGGGPIVRVGDRLSIFTPWLTAACAQRAEELFGGPSTPTASQTVKASPPRPWQRKLMAGGACEASVFCIAGYDATCLCLPLGNYHNMAHLDAVQAGTYDASRLGPPRCAREFIHTRDFLGLVDLLVGLGERLPAPARAGGLGERFERLYNERAYVLGDAPAAKAPRRSSPAAAARRAAGKPARPARAPRPGKRRR